MVISKHKLLREISNSANQLGYIDVIKVAEIFGIDVFISDEFKNDEPAFIEFNKDKNNFSIVVNSKHSEKRQRFSIAHELSHFILHNDELRKTNKLGRENAYSMDRNSEIEADKLAERILMPTPFINSFLSRQGISKETKLNRKIIQEVADQFNVSMVACIIRLRNLKYYVPYIELYPY